MAPARRQIDKATLEEYLKERRPEGGTYNIWHNRWKGLERDWSKKGARAGFKCDPARDSGDTAGTNNRNAYFCLFFAKGMCAQGADCSMWHRIPNENDEIETTIDCFGRDKYTEFRQDMGGVGSFNTLNKTLYVGRISVTHNMRDVVIKHFQPFGELERVRLLRHRGVAFVTYKSRNNAEFAREAMMNQGLDNNEIINVRWATQEQSTMKGDEDNKGDKGNGQYDRAEMYERQNMESELPAEYTQMKREVDEDGFREMEMNAKRQRYSEQNDGYYADTQAVEAIYGYTQQNPDVPQVEQPQQQQSNLKVTGIIPANVLNSLKTLKDSNAATSTSPSAPSSSTKEKPSQAGGLGNLASYGSDSEDEDDD